MSTTTAFKIGNCNQPILLLGYAHEVLDQLNNFDPHLDFVPSVERYLWSQDKQQIFSFPHTIPNSNGRYGLYTNHISYDAYRFSSLPSKTEVLGTNFEQSGAQLFWFRSFLSNPHIYYWGIDKVNNLNSQGLQFCENLIHWIIRSPLQKRLGEALVALQLPDVIGEDYWAIQGGGGFGYPLEPSLRYSYYVADMVVPNGLNVNITAFGSWLLSCYNSKLGCFEDLASPQFFDRCVTTAMGVLLAENLEVLDQLNTTQILNYLKNCQDPISGGFLSELLSSQTSLSTTRFAIQSLSVLNQLPLLNTQAVIDYVVNCQELSPLNPDYGGFYSNDNSGFSASLLHALDALLTLEQLDALDAINQSALLTFIAKCEDPSGSSIFDTKQLLDSDEWIIGTSCCIQILSLLNKTDLYDTSISRAFILSNQFPNGGWGRGDTLHDFHNSPDETWFGVYALALTGGLETTEPLLTQYLNHCCTEWGGASEPVIFGDFLTGAEIVFVLSQVDALQLLNLTIYLKYLQNCWSQSRNSFLAHQLPSSHGTNTDLPTPDRIAIEAGTYGPLYHYAYSQLALILNLTDEAWINYATQIRLEIEASQSNHPDFKGMFGLQHLFVGHESNLTFRFDTTCWSLLAHQALGGNPTDFNNHTAALSYLTRCLQTNSTHQYFFDPQHPIPIPEPWRVAEGYLAETWLGLQAWSYLDPALQNLDGQKLANYVASLLQDNATIITTFYATEILHLLVETELNPEALNLILWDYMKANILNAFDYDGFVSDSSLPQGKWMPYLVNLALQLIHRFQLLSQLDGNPILNLTNLICSTGTVPLGGNFSLSALVNEIRWGRVPATIEIQTRIFKTIFIDICSMSLLGNFQIHFGIPVIAGALGPQNLTLCAYSPGATPYYVNLFDICTGWGLLTLQTDISQNFTIPRGVPMNITMQLGLEGAIAPLEPLDHAIVTVSLETTNETFLATSGEANLFHISISTQNLHPQRHNIQINASVPYCTPYTTTSIITVIVLNVIKPTISLTGVPLEIDDPALQPTLDLDIHLTYINNSRVHGLAANLSLQIQPQNANSLFTYFVLTDSSGVGELMIATPQPGFYQLIIRFEGQPGFAPCSLTTPFLVRNTQTPFIDFSSFLLIESITLMILGLIAGLIVILRLQQRLNRFLRAVQPDLDSSLDTSSDVLLSIVQSADNSEHEILTESSDE